MKEDGQIVRQEKSKGRKIAEVVVFSAAFLGASAGIGVLGGLATGEAIKQINEAKYSCTIKTKSNSSEKVTILTGYQVGKFHENEKNSNKTIDCENGRFDESNIGDDDDNGGFYFPGFAGPIG